MKYVAIVFLLMVITACSTQTIIEEDNSANEIIDQVDQESDQLAKNTETTINNLPVVTNTRTDEGPTTVQVSSDSATTSPQQLTIPEPSTVQPTTPCPPACTNSGYIRESRTVAIATKFSESFGKLTAKNSKLLTVFKTQFNGQETQYYETLEFGPNYPVIHTGLSVADYKDDEYQDKLFLQLNSESIKYFVKFPTKPDWNLVSEQNPLRIKFMGKEIRLNDVNEANKNILVQSGTELTFDVGTQVIIDGKIIKLIRLSEANETNTTEYGAKFKILRSSGNFDLIIREGDSPIFYGDEVKVLDLYNDEGLEFDSVKVAFNGEPVIFNYNESIENNYNNGSIGFNQSTYTFLGVVDSSETVPAGTRYITFSVNGNYYTLALGSTKVVDGIQIFFKEITANNQVKLIVGQEVLKSYSDGDSFIGQDIDDPLWVWDFDRLNQGEIGIAFNQSWLATDNVLYEKEKFDLGNNYMYLQITDYEPKATERLELATTTVPLYSSNGNEMLFPAARVLKIKLNYLNVSNGSVMVAGNWGTDTIYLHGTQKDVMDVYVKPVNSAKAVFVKTVESPDQIFDIYVGGNKYEVLYVKEQWPRTVPRPQLNDTNLSINNALYFDFGFDKINVRVVNTPVGIDYLGLSDSDTITLRDLVYARLVNPENNGHAVYDISNWGEDTRTEYGVIIKNPALYSASDKIIMDIPVGQVKASVEIYGYRNKIPGSTPINPEEEEFVRMQQ